MRINHNLAALNTHRQLEANTASASKSLEKLSSGLRINRAGDDAAGLAISEKMRGQIRGLQQASSNAQDSISMIQTAEGALSETHSILQRMRELAIQGSNSTATDSDRTVLQKEVTQLKSEVDRIASSTEFNTKKLLNGSLSTVKSAQGTVANSGDVKEALTAATSGLTDGGAGLTVSSAVAASAGTAGTATGSTVIGITTTVTAATNDMFKVAVNGNAVSADITIAAGTYDRAGFLAAVNTTLAGYNTGKNLSEQVSASYTSDFKLQFTTAITGTGAGVVVSAGTKDATAVTMGFASQNATIGTDTVLAVSSGVTNIVAGSNDSFKITVDGGAQQTLTLTAGNYSTQKSVVDEINKQILNNTGLTGKVSASLDSNNRVQFTSTSTGSTSSVAIASGTKDALAAIGYAGGATTLSSSNINNTTGTLDLATVATAAKFDLTIGGKLQTIDLTGMAGIDKKTTRDSLVQALQTKINTAFGAGAVTVATNGGKISLVNNSGSAVFSVADGTGTGATVIFGGASVAAAVGAYGGTTSATGSNATGGVLTNNTKLTNLTDTDSNKLGLTAGNVITISGTQNGSAFSTQLSVGASSTIADVINQMKSVPQLSKANISFDLQKGEFAISGENGLNKDISNLKFTAQKSATDTTAIADFNKKFQSFTTTQQAQNASSDSSLSMQIGANEGQTLKVDINDMGTQGLRIQDVDVSTTAGAQSAVSVINNAIESVSAERSKLGAFQNRLEHTINNLGTSAENLTSSESRIRDVDMAKEMMEFTKNNILSQAAQSMLAQANQQPQGVLQLLR